MGGFMVNGCGAAESFYPIRSVGTFYCKYCRADRDFSVGEAKMKIRVLYIPTVSVKTKYVVMCFKCKNGYYIEESDKDDILFNRVRVVVTEKGVNFLSNNSAAALTDNSSYQQPRLLEYNDADTGRVTEPVPESNSSIADTSSYEEEKVSYTYDNDASDTSSAQVINVEPTQPLPESITKRVVKQCPNCRLLFGEDKESCPVCGSELKVRE